MTKTLIASEEVILVFAHARIGQAWWTGLVHTQVWSLEMHIEGSGAGTKIWGVASDMVLDKDLGRCIGHDSGISCGSYRTHRVITFEMHWFSFAGLSLA